MARSKVIVGIYDYVVITLGVILFVMAWQCFLLPNNMIDGGLTGASALLSMDPGLDHPRPGIRPQDHLCHPAFHRAVQGPRE